MIKNSILDIVWVITYATKYYFINETFQESIYKVFNIKL